MVYYIKEEKEGGVFLSSEAYEMLALFMRYVFVLIGAVIVWRSFRWLSRDNRAYHREMRSLPDAGLVGEVVNLTTGEAQPLPREGVMGASRACDIRLKGEGILSRHARFEFTPGKGLKIIPTGKAHVLLGGVQLTQPGYAIHGTMLQMGENMLRVRLFAGLDVPQHPAYPEPDAVLESGVYLAPWEGQEASAPAFPSMEMAEPEQDAFMPYSVASVPPGAPVEPLTSQHYDGNYTDAGEMTWQYAYSLEDLRSAMDQNEWRQIQPTGEVPDGEEALPYESPLPHRRRRKRRG